MVFYLQSQSFQWHWTMLLFIIKDCGGVKFVLKVCVHEGFVKLDGISLTCSVHDCQHDGGDPCDLAVGGIEDDLDVFEEGSNGFGKRVGETNGDEGSQDHSPPPAAVWRGNSLGTCGGGRHTVPSQLSVRPATTKQMCHAV